MTQAITLRTNLADSPAIQAIKDGRVRSDIVTFDFCGPKVSHDGFKPMVRHEVFDAGELAINTYLQAKAYGKPWTLLPTPLIGNFQHQCIAYNQALGHLDPKDLEGRRVGVRMYAQTTGLWVRGILQHEYGVDLDQVRWMTLEDSHLAEYADPVNCERLPSGAQIAQMLLNGELTAAILSRKDMPQDPRIAPLIPQPEAAAKAWYAREGVIPINHVFVVHSRIAQERPDVLREIYRMIQESRALAPSSAVAHLPPLGTLANRKGLDMAIQWSYEQHIIPTRLAVDDLFDATTLAMN